MAPLNCRICFTCGLILLVLLSLINMELFFQSEEEFRKNADRLRGAGVATAANLSDAHTYSYKWLPQLQSNDVVQGFTSDLAKANEISFSTKHLSTITAFVTMFKPAEITYEGSYRLVANASIRYGPINISGFAMLKVRSLDTGNLRPFMKRRLDTAINRLNGTFSKSGLRVSAISLSLRANRHRDRLGGTALRGSRQTRRGSGEKSQVRVDTELLLVGLMSQIDASTLLLGESHVTDFPAIWPRRCALRGAADRAISSIFVGSTSAASAASVDAGELRHQGSVSAAQVGEAQATPASNEIVGEVRGLLHSSDCGFSLSFTTTRVEPKSVEGKIIHYWYWRCLLGVVQIRSFLTQLRHAEEDLVMAARVSIVSIVFLALVDLLDAVCHIVFGFFAVGSMWHFSGIALGKLGIFGMLEMPYAVSIWRSRNQQLYRGGWEALRARVARFYCQLCYGIVFSLFSSLVLMVRNTASFFLCLQGLWLPQIFCDAWSGSKSNLHPQFIIGVSLTHCFEFLYVFGCPSSVFNIGDQLPHLLGSPSFSLCFAAAFLHGLQLAVMAAQRRWGPRFFVPWILMPRVYNYHRPSARRPGSDSNASDCAICMVPLESGGLCVVAPCDHEFHRACLERWMDVKMECPTCRGALPPIT